MYIHVYVYAYAYAKCINIHIYVHMYMYMYIYKYLYTYTYMYTHTYMYMHRHTCIRTRGCMISNTLQKRHFFDSSEQESNTIIATTLQNYATPEPGIASPGHTPPFAPGSRVRQLRESRPGQWSRHLEYRECMNVYVYA